MHTDPYYRHIITTAIETQKQFNSQRLREATGGVVQHGLLKGYYLDPRRTWSAGDVGSQLLGLYEQEVCALLDRLRRERSTLVDLGAADGYYGVGLVAIGAFARSFCFELEERSRAALGELVVSLGLGDRVQILGAAASDLPARVAGLGVDLADSVILCDVEGAEFDIFDEASLEALAAAYIIIENHDFIRPERYASSAALIERASRFFHVAEIKVGPRDLRRIPLLEDHWNDNDRWLLCSEGRAKLASWFLLTPRTRRPWSDDDLEAILRAYQASF